MKITIIVERIFLQKKLPVDKDEKEKPDPGTSESQLATVKKENRRKKTRRGTNKLLAA